MIEAIAGLQSIKSNLTNADQQILKKLRNWFNPTHKQMISGPSTGNIQQVPLGVVDLFQVGIVCYGFDAFL